MAYVTKKRINPYLIVLMKHLLYYECVGLSNPPNPSQIKVIIELKKIYESENRELTRSKKNRKLIARMAESLRVDILGKKDFEFSPRKLDLFAIQISILDKFSSWEDFAKKYGNEEPALVAADHYMDVPYSQLSQRIKNRIESWARQKILDLNDRWMVFGKWSNFQADSGECLSEIFAFQGHDFAIRTGEIEDLNIDLLRDHFGRRRTQLYSPEVTQRYQASIFGDRHREANFYEEVHKVLRNIFFMHIDILGIWGGIVVLPLKKECFVKLVGGMLFFDKIEPSCVETRNNVSNSILFIYLFHFIQERSFHLLSKCIGNIFMSLTTQDNFEIWGIERDGFDRDWMDFWGFHKTQLVESDLDRQLGIKRKFKLRGTTWSHLEMILHS